MKTPEEVAAGLLRPNGESFTLSAGGETVYNLPPHVADLVNEAMVAAIEADRTQRDRTLSAVEIVGEEWRLYMEDGGHRLCEIEDGDTMETLVSVALDPEARR